MQKKTQITDIDETISIQQNDQESNRPALLKFWEINRFFKCPVIGMCLSISENKKILKKAGFTIKKKNSFEIHETLVASSENENQISKRVDNLLNRKYGKETEILLGLEHNEFMTHCKTAFESGNLKSALWAAAISPELPVELKEELFGKIHMAMHFSVQECNQLKGKLNKQQKKLDDMQISIKEVARFKRSLQKENELLRLKQKDLNTKTAILEREKIELKEILAGLKNQNRVTKLEQKNENLIEELDALIGNFNEKQRETALLKEENFLLSTEIEQQRESNCSFRKETREIIGKVFELNHCDASCPSFDLCKKRVLIVGGITRMESLYRQLIENSGGIFEYHDGYMKKGVKMLESRLRRADFVLCPVNCNSHAACSIVKNLARKHKKTVHMLTNSSLNAVSKVIWGNENNRGTVAN